MKALFSKTGLGLLAALLLVLLFYGRMLGEAQDTLAKTAQKQTEKQAKERADKDADAQRHRELVSALQNLKNPAATATAPTPTSTTPRTPDTLQALQANLGVTADGIRGARTEAALRLRSPAAAGTATPQPQAPTPPPAGRRWGLAALLLLGLGAGAYVGYQGWRESQTELVDADPNDRDTSLLEALMSAFAGAIGRALPIPRQVKRFASKARLQHNLLRQLADETQHTSAFQFDVPQQVLAFLLLLLLESGDAAPGNHRAGPLRELGEGAFVEGLRERFRAWHRAGTDQKAYTIFIQQAGYLEVLAYADLLAEVDEASADRLLVQLHRLNAGLLV